MKEKVMSLKSFCLVEMNATVLSHILNLPPSVEVDAAYCDVSRPGVIVFRIRGSGYPDAAGQLTLCTWSRELDGSIRYGAPIFSKPKPRKPKAKAKAKAKRKASA